MSADKQQPSSEYLKRTCLICGCHTNQTINIYEPRSGPNIVQLIQAKFKFQPLNEDKYLCFSCNNWLINWHSLQAVNSNDAESPSHMNSSSSNMVHDKANAPLNAGQPQKQKQRPVATVRPRQVESLETHTQPTMAAATETPASLDVEAATSTDADADAELDSQQLTMPYGKRRFRRGQQLRRCVNDHKMLRQCSVCGSAIVLRLGVNANASLTLNKLKRTKYAQCRKCREIANWRALHMKSLATWAQRSLASGSKMLPASTPATANNGSSSSNGGINTNNQSNPSSSSSSGSITHQRYQRPRIDGKVVAMFRRLGTTLSREAPEETQTPTAPLPPIMSPTKSKPRWSRKLDDDEILLEFESAISEVLPASSAPIDCRGDDDSNNNSSEASVVARRKLSYPITTATTTKNNNNTVEVDHHTAALPSGVDLQKFRLPQGLSISLV